ncbi:DinB family protein [Brevibacillus ginsengisoli]|uniref:DinB family protein n=1 Tax=Brevibacillus ginsengisoli TaxID=363854 RepID=UPI003CF8C780
MFVTIQDFVEAWKNNAKGTQRILDTLTDESLSQAVTPQDRTLGRMAWHIVASIPEMLGRTGLTFEAPEHDAPVPATAKEIAEGYRQASEGMLKAIETNWTDATLKETDDMYGEQWPKGLTLTILIEHEIHHRGQMTVLMRQAGLPVPGVFGPSREEWGQYGMEAPTF